MQITKLRLSGFKSFVQPTELAIEPGLTGIVGPNGCGKSNLADALRWVMGETSARGLRGGEMDDVIFAGTAARPAFDLAEVGLHINAPEVALPGLDEFDELELSRRIGRGVGSVFRINGKELRARDVQLLFADAASGARSAAIVSQAQIGTLVEAKPSDRRRLLEEAAGVGGLQARRHEAELKLQAAEANLMRVQDLLLTLEEQENALRKQARQAERYRKLSAAYRATEAALLIGRWRLARAELAAAEDTLRRGRQQVSIEAERLTVARAERERAAAALSKLRAAEAELATEAARLSERLAVVDEQARRQDEGRARLAERERQTAEDRKHAEASVEDARATRERLAVERAGLLNAIEQIGCELEQTAAAEAEAAAAQERADAALRQALAGVAEAEARIRQLLDRRTQAEDERQGQDQVRRELESRLEDLSTTSEVATEPGLARAPEAELAAASAAREAAEAALEAAERDREAIRNALQDAERRLRHEQDALRAQQEQIRRAEEQRRSLLERRQELEQRRGRLAGRVAELAALAGQRAARRAELGLPALEAEAAMAERRLAETAAALEAGRAAAASATTAEQRARSAVQERGAAVMRLEAEAEALAELAGPDAGGPALIDLIEVGTEHAEALAAALGDDLVGSLDESAPIHWRPDVGAAGVSGAPALPAGCRALAEVVTAPPALARRLAQVALADPGKAADLQLALAQGQRLVSPDGGLWRWDGFVRRPEAREGGAARLRQQTRRRQLADALVEARAHRTRGEQALAEAGARSRAAAAEVAEASEAEANARRARDAARDALARAQASDAALAAEQIALDKERGALEAEQAEIDELSRGIDQQLAHAAAPAADDPALEALSERVRQAEAARDEATRRDQAADTTRGETRATLAAARDKLAAAAAEVERQRAVETAAAAARREHELARAQIEARLGRLNEEQATHRATAVALEAGLRAAEAELAAARAGLSEAEAVASVARQRHADLAMEHARLRDRAGAAAARSTTIEQEVELWSQRASAAGARVAELAERQRELTAELVQLERLPATIGEQQVQLRTAVAEVEDRRAALGRELAVAEVALDEAQSNLDRTEAARVEGRELAARLEAQLERTEADCRAAEVAARAHLVDAEDGLHALPTAAELGELESELARLGAARERLGPVNLRAIDEAQELALRIETLKAEQAELSGAIERLRRAIATLNREGRERLRAAFGRVEAHFEALFARLFGGGRARLWLTDLEDPLAAGLELAASPPGKKLQSMSLLSGGEKALTALALIFAVFLTRPAPLCLLDEVDAPLDDANVGRLMELLEELTEGTRTRFVVITHHPLTMARMHRLYGVTMAERGISQLVSVDLTSAIELRATA